MVAMRRLQKVANDMALARTTVGKISDGINQAPGPIPILKNAKYKPRENTPKPAFTDEPRKLNASRQRAIAIPNRNKRFRLN